MSCISYSFSWHSRLEARFMWLTFWGLGNTCWKATEPHGSQQVRTETGPVAWLGIFLCISVIIELPPHARHSHYWIVTWQMSVWLTALTGWFPSRSPSSMKLWRLHLSCEFSCIQAFICSFWHFSWHSRLFQYTSSVGKGLCQLHNSSLLSDLGDSTGILFFYDINILSSPQ